MTSTSKMKVDFLFIVEKSYYKTVIEFNFGRHKDLSTLKKCINLSLAALVNITLSGR